MPEQNYEWLPHDDLLRYEEIAELVTIFTCAGVRKVRLTGGEPLLRRDLERLVRLLGANACIEDIALTTNGILLADSARRLREAGLGRVTVSLDTLRPERFLALTRQDLHDRVIEGIHAAKDAGFPPLKLDTVLMRGVNDDEILPMLDFARELGAELRFIEYMDVGGATHWSEADVVSRQEILDRIARQHGRVEPIPGQGSAPAERFALSDGSTFGIIASVTAPFCRDCDRSRLTADGQWYLCLYAARGIDLRGPLRRGARRGELASLIAAEWSARMDRGAEERRAGRSRGPFIPVETLRRDPHLEMHTRGG